MLRDETHFFPTAAAHALSILDDAGTLKEAISVVALNARANPGEFDHWLQVLRALDGGAEA